MIPEHELNQKIEEYCKLRGIRVVRGTVQPQYQAEIQRFISQTIKTHNKKYRKDMFYKKQSIGETNTIKSIMKGV